MKRCAGIGRAVLHRSRPRRLLALLLALGPLAAGLSPPVAAAAPESSQGTSSLEGVVVARAVFDINRSRPETILEALELVARSRETIRDQGATPDFQVVLRGAAARVLTNHGDLTDAERRRREAVAERLRVLSSRGVRFIVEGRTARPDEAGDGKPLPRLAPADNVLVTLIALQNKGYALIPLY